MFEHLNGVAKAIKEIVSVKEISPALLAISFATALILFCPGNVAEALGIVTFRSTYRGELGLTLIVAVSYLSAQFLWWRRGVWLNRRENQKAIEVRQKRLHELTREEKSFLMKFVIDGINSLKIPPTSGLAGGLVDKEIIFQSSSIGHPEYGFPYNIRPWARDYLQKHPELLKAEDIPDEEDPK